MTFSWHFFECFYTMLSWQFPDISLNVFIQWFQIVFSALVRHIQTHPKKKQKNNKQTKKSYRKKWKKENTYHSFNCRWHVPGWPRARSFEYWWRFCTSNSRTSPLALVRSAPFRRPSMKKKFTSCFTHVPSRIQIPISMCVRNTAWIL